ncbi:MAG: TrmH family RNA methyltransferase [Spirochaetales bacterium]|nr:TrmH family RNA methyltransferase [Spirochaetales bacterium]
MIAVRKLMTLTPLHRARKAAQVLGHVEADYRNGQTGASAWVLELCSAFAADESLSGELRALAAEASGEAGRTALSSPEAGIRVINRLSRGLEAHAGLSPADWDFRQPLGVGLAGEVRLVYPGVRAYLEDVRSPFNVGSMFRSADAFGVAELILSGFTADPGHPRATRSAMGASDVVPWRRGGLEALAESGEAFALELRGQPLDSFEFPEHGIVVLGSEELGVSPEAMALCPRTVSIPMLGAKGSLNVGVAFGVLMDAWRRSLANRGVEPVRLTESRPPGESLNASIS